MPAPKWYKRRPTLGARNSARQRGGPCSQASGEPKRTAHAAGALSRPRAASATFRPRIGSTILSPPLQTALGRTRGILVACRSLSPGSALSVHSDEGVPIHCPPKSAKYCRRTYEKLFQFQFVYSQPIRIEAVRGQDPLAFIFVRETWSKQQTL